MISALRALLIVVLAAIAFEFVFLPREKYRALDPDEPIAADGSMIAGRSRTIYDTNPLYRAASQARADLDDPADFATPLKNERAWAEGSRADIKRLIGRLDWSRCQDRPHRLLIDTVHDYYGTRGREKQSFALRGPRAKAAIDEVWSTPLDRQIDDFVRHAVQYGVLHKSEVPANIYPEFAKTFANTEEFGAGCAPQKAGKAAQKF